MALPLEDYALVGDAHGAALVGRDGSVDWLCLPRFDSPACLAALLDEPRAGRWLLAPTGGASTSSHWSYRGDSLILESDWETAGGHVRVVDFMPPKGRASDLIRVVEGVSGRVEMRTELIVRFDYGNVLPWARVLPDGRHTYVAGPDALYLDTKVPLHPVEMTTEGVFSVSAGQRVPFTLTWNASHLPPPPRLDPDRAENDTELWWSRWMRSCTYHGPYDDAVRRSLVVLKALTFQPTGGIVAAATTSLPEQLGGPRNWDYRYCWLRDATITLLALLEGGFHSEAAAWRRWLLRAVAGDPADLQIMYGVAGERRLTERELPWLAGYEKSTPVRIGNAAVDQLQLDVYGEVMDALHQSRRARLPIRADSGPFTDAGPHHANKVGDDVDPSWPLQTALLDFLESAWVRPDSGLWEMRGPARHFTYSKVMAWVAVDRAIQGAEGFGLPAPIERWRALRETIRDDVLTHSYDANRNTFTQSYGSRYLDASLLNIPLVGFLKPDDPRVAGTVKAVTEDLMTDSGLLLRYDPQACEDGLPGQEGAFLACTFWLAECQALLGRIDEATETFERLLDLRNDLGLLSEEFDPVAKRLVGNFPQAFSHVPLINTAANLQRARDNGAQPVRSDRT
jgi:GH15 family glucan-1,4-alpha-glucosidase